MDRYIIHRALIAFVEWYNWRPPNTDPPKKTRAELIQERQAEQNIQLDRIEAKVDRILGEPYDHSS